MHNSPSTPNTIRILCLGDVVGQPGRLALKEHLRAIKKEYCIDFTVVNAENACGGLGLDARHAYEIKDFGVDVITLGDHTWAKKEIISVFEQQPDWIIRPYNYPVGAPGSGVTSIRTDKGVLVSVINLLGRVFMDGLWDCPFASSDKIFSELPSEAKITICDFHCEATSEKIAFGRYLDGKASLVFGTHTHVQTADETILPEGTAFITDVGMCGATSGVIGMDAETALFRFTTGRPKFYESAKGSGTLHGVICEVNPETGKSVRIERLRYPPQP